VLRRRPGGPLPGLRPHLPRWGRQEEKRLRKAAIPGACSLSGLRPHLPRRGRQGKSTYAKRPFRGSARAQRAQRAWRESRAEAGRVVAADAPTPFRGCGPASPAGEAGGSTCAKRPFRGEAGGCGRARRAQRKISRGGGVCNGGGPGPFSGLRPHLPAGEAGGRSACAKRSFRGCGPTSPAGGGRERAPARSGHAMLRPGGTRRKTRAEQAPPAQDLFVCRRNQSRTPASR